MAKCTGRRCPMQVGYKVDECDYKDCYYRTEPITNAQKIRSMSDEELEEGIGRLSLGYQPWCNHNCKVNGDYNCNRCLKSWLQQPTRDAPPHCTKKPNN